MIQKEPTPVDPREDRSRSRFLALNMVYIGAIALTVVGLMNITGQLLPEYAPWLGYVVLFVGMFDLFLFPNILRKVWARKDAARNAGISE